VKYELVDTHIADPLAPMGACPDAENAHRYRRGWKGTGKVGFNAIATRHTTN
jgi:hypothetical protein